MGQRVWSSHQDWNVKNGLLCGKRTRLGPGRPVGNGAVTQVGEDSHLNSGGGCETGKKNVVI